MATSLAPLGFQKINNKDQEVSENWNWINKEQISWVGEIGLWVWGQPGFHNETLSQKQTKAQLLIIFSFKFLKFKYFSFFGSTF
jgi:hypothetical protein